MQFVHLLIRGRTGEEKHLQPTVPINQAQAPQAGDEAVQQVAGGKRSSTVEEKEGTARKWRSGDG